MMTILQLYQHILMYKYVLVYINIYQYKYTNIYLHSVICKTQN